jgi:Amino acid transporters
MSLVYAPFLTWMPPTNIYVASRSLYGLAKDEQAPAIFKKTTKHGVPICAIALPSLFVLLAFLNVSTSSSQVFSYLVSLSTVLGLQNWINLLVTYFSFLRGLKVQGISPAELPYRGPLQPYGAYFAFFMTALLIFFNGFGAFILHFKVATFVVSYIAVVVYILVIFSWKFWKGTHRVRASEMDLVTNRRIEDEGPAPSNPPFLSRVWGVIFGK